jgi:uncharacterized membrane protein
LNNPITFYILGIVFVVLGFIDLAFMTYSGHGINGVMVAIWGSCCLVWGVRNELLRRR